jgi:hypothetical protein
MITDECLVRAALVRLAPDVFALVDALLTMIDALT